MTTKSKRTKAEPLRWIKKNGAYLALVLLLLSAFALRMVDLTDAPLDFHPTRQYRGALIARSLYYQLSPSEDAVLQSQALAARQSVAELEPPILESIVAFSYLLAGGENIWVARIVNSFFWVLGGLALFTLARRATSLGAALIALAYYFFLPFSVFASRSFQPDPFMVSWMALACYAAFRWSEQRNWKWALLAGASAGFAVLIKAVALYFMGGMLLAVVLYSLGFRRALRDTQVWAMLALAVLPPASYYLLNIGDTTGNFIQNWVVALLPIAYDPGFYVRWLNFLGDIFGLTLIFAALTGVLLAKGAYRWILAGLWIGYLINGITLPHQTLTHNYYHLPLLLIISLSLAPLLELIVREVASRQKIWRAGFTLIVLVAIAFNALISRNTLVAEDFRIEIDYWTRVGDSVPQNGRIIGLVQHYGHLLNYYGGRNVALWPVTSELQLAELRGNDTSDFEAAFLKRTAGADYFLVTTFNQLEKQAQLGERLYSQYPVWGEGAGYIIFDLRADPSGDD